MSAIPNMRVYLPSDGFQTAELVRALVADNKPAYIRVGRNPVEDVYRGRVPVPDGPCHLGASRHRCDDCRHR